MRSVSPGIDASEPAGPVRRERRPTDQPSAIQDPWSERCSSIIPRSLRRHVPDSGVLWCETERMLHLRISSPTAITEAVMSILSDDPAVSSLAVLRGASVRPAGDVVLADVAREAANDLV